MTDLPPVEDLKKEEEREKKEEEEMKKKEEEERIAKEKFEKEEAERIAKEKEEEEKKLKEEAEKQQQIELKKKAEEELKAKKAEEAKKKATEARKKQKIEKKRGEIKEQVAVLFAPEAMSKPIIEQQKADKSVRGFTSSVSILEKLIKDAGLDEEFEDFITKFSDEDPEVVAAIKKGYSLGLQVKKIKAARIVRLVVQW
jgi:hypothetical protein